MNRRGTAWKSLLLIGGILLAGCVDYPPPRQEPIPSAQNPDAPHYQNPELKPLPPQAPPPPRNVPPPATTAPPAPAAPNDYQH